MADDALTFKTPFDEQIAFFRQKLNLPTERWDDIWQAAHDRAFIVAGAAKADLLNDLRSAVGTAIADGKSLGWFRQQFDDIVAKHGWSGWTGDGSKAGRNWRTRVIYQTNLATSYAAGRWQQLNDPDLVKLRPFWQYIHADGVMHPRPQHLAWHGLTLPREHVFWRTHFPPNGWGCHCRVRAVGQAEYDAAAAHGRGPDAAPAVDDTTGIDPGWEYAPGASQTVPLRQMVQEKLITYPEAISTALSREVTRYINATEDVAAYAARVLAERTKTEPLWIGFVDNHEAVSAVAGEDVKGFLLLLPDEAPRHALSSHGHDGGDQRPPRAEDYRHVAAVLTEADRLDPGKQTAKGLSTVVAWKRVGDEVFRCVYEVRPGKKNRALALISLVIKV